MRFSMWRAKRRRTRHKTASRDVGGDSLGAAFRLTDVDRARRGSASATDGARESGRKKDHMTDPTLPQRLSECGRAMAMAAVPAMGTSGTINVPTVIAACARMAGTYLFRSFNLHVQSAGPGQVVLSQEAAANTPALLQTCAGILKELGTTIASAPVTPLDADTHKPKLDLLQTQAFMEPSFAPLQATHSLNDRQMAHAAAIGTAILIHHFG